MPRLELSPYGLIIQSVLLSPNMVLQTCRRCGRDDKGLELGPDFSAVLLIAPLTPQPTFNSRPLS